MSSEDRALNTLRQESFTRLVQSLASKYVVTEEFVSNLFTQERQMTTSHWEKFFSHLPEQLDQNEVLVNHFLLRIVEANLKAEKAEKEAILDPLTGLFNRRAFDLALEKRVRHFIRSDADVSNFSLIIFDLDCFKVINDTFGHNTGDIVLKEISKIATTEVRAIDLLARYGGEEFAIIVDSDSSSAFEIAERIRKSFVEIEVSSLGIDPELHPNITASFGVSEFELKGNDPKKPVKSLVEATLQSIKSLIDAADTAMYKAKNQGKNCVVIAGK